MAAYHLIVKINFNPDWINRLKKFWASVKAEGIPTDERVLFIENDEQLEKVMKLAKSNFIEIRLMKDDTYVNNYSEKNLSGNPHNS